MNLDGTGWKRWTGPEIKTSHSAEWSSDGSRFLHVTSDWLGRGELVLVDRNDDTRTTIAGNALHGYWSR